MATEENTTERWLPVVGFEGLYEVSDFGRVRSASGRVLQLHSKPCGYIAARLYHKGKKFPRTVHRLVLSAFNRIPGPGDQANHIDCCKSNNRLENLEWCTARENRMHAIANGLVQLPSGEDHYRSRLSEASVREIRQRYENGESQTALARIFGISQAGISLVILRINWKNIA